MTKTRKRSVKSKLIIMIVLPVMIVGIFCVLFSKTRYVNQIVAGLKSGMKGTAVAALEAYELGFEGDYLKNDSGEVWKGDSLNISDTTTVVDRIKKESNMEATFFFGDERIMTSILDKDGNRIVGTKASDAVIDAVLKNGKEYFSTNTMINGERYYTYYMPIKQSSTGEICGMFFVGRNGEATDREIANVNLICALAVLGIIIICTLLCYMILSKMTAALKRSVSALDSVAKGDLEVHLSNSDLKRSDEVGEIAKATERLSKQLKLIIGEVQRISLELEESAIHLDKSAEVTLKTTEEVERAINDISIGAMNQAEETQKATEHVVEMGNMMSETTEGVELLSDNSKTIEDSAKRATEIFLKLREINSKVNETIKTIYNQTNMTNKSVVDIKQAINIITAIAEETNLLSLNASIEAARAGEQGRGFAVVAAQIQKLAEQSNASASEIERIVTSLILDSNKAVDTMNEVKTVIMEQSKNVEVTESIFDEVKNGVVESIQSIHKIRNTTENMDEARVAVIDIVQSLSAIAQENAAATEETSASSQEVTATVSDVSDAAAQLKDIAKQLTSAINAFKID